MIPESVRKQLGPMVHAEECDPFLFGGINESISSGREAAQDKPVVAVSEYAYGPGRLLTIHSDDLPRFIRAYLGTHSPAKRLVKVRSREDSEGRLPQLSHGTPEPDFSF